MNGKMAMLRPAFLACVAIMAVSGFGAAALPDGWTPKFYHGLEAVGSVTWEPDAFKGTGREERLVERRQGEDAEVIALFNYDSKDTIRVAVAGAVYEIPSYGTKFVEVNASK